MTYVPIVGGAGLVEHLTGFLNPVDVPASWVEAMWPIEPPHYVGHAAPAAPLYQSALRDQAVAIAESVRSQRAGSDPKRIIWYDTDHWLNNQAWQDQRAWLQPFLETGSGGSR